MRILEKSLLSLMLRLAPRRQGGRRRLIARIGFWFALIGVFQPAAWADTNVTSSVTGIVAYAAAVAHGYEILISPALPTGTEGCTYTPAIALWIDSTDANAPTLYATVLSAFISGQALVFGVRGCGDSGQLPQVYSVQLGTLN